MKAGKLLVAVSLALVSVGHDASRWCGVLRHGAEMFPKDLADFVLNNQDSPEVRP